MQAPVTIPAPLGRPDTPPERLVPALLTIPLPIVRAPECKPPAPVTMPPRRVCPGPAAALPCSPAVAGPSPVTMLPPGLPALEPLTELPLRFVPAESVGLGGLHFFPCRLSSACRRLIRRKSGHHRDEEEGSLSGLHDTLLGRAIRPRQVVKSKSRALFGLSVDRCAEFPSVADMPKEPRCGRSLLPAARLRRFRQRSGTANRIRSQTARIGMRCGSPA
jgi:hypothetical protein